MKLYKVRTQDGTIIEGVLNWKEEQLGLIFNPMPCKCCGKARGYEPFRILKVSELS